MSDRSLPMSGTGAVERPDAFNEAWCDEHGMTHFGPGDPDCFGFAPLPSPGTTAEREESDVRVHPRVG